VKKALRIIKTSLVALIVIFAVFMMIFTIMSVTTFNRNDRDLFGYKAFIVNTDSMAKTDFDAGDLIFVKEVNPSTLKEGDIITFLSQDKDSFNEIITHKIKERTTDAKGEPGFITYGTTTGEEDKTIVTYPYVLGKYSSHLDGVGTFFNFLKTTQGYIVCIFIPFMLLIIYQGVNCIRLFKRYKAEQRAELDEERAQIEAERAEAARMMAELKALKEELQMNSSSPAPEEKDKIPEEEKEFDASEDEPFGTPEDDDKKDEDTNE